MDPLFEKSKLVIDSTQFKRIIFDDHSRKDAEVHGIEFEVSYRERKVRLIALPYQDPMEVYEKGKAPYLARMEDIKKIVDRCLRENVGQIVIGETKKNDQTWEFAFEENVIDPSLLEEILMEKVATLTPEEEAQLDSENRQAIADWREGKLSSSPFDDMTDDKWYSDLETRIKNGEEVSQLYLLPLSQLTLDGIRRLSRNFHVVQVKSSLDKKVEGIFYQIFNEEGMKVGSLLGTVHIVDKESLQLNPDIHADLRKTKSIYLEIISKNSMSTQQTKGKNAVPTEQEEKLLVASEIILREAEKNGVKPFKCDQIRKKFSLQKTDQKLDTILNWMNEFKIQKAQAAIYSPEQFLGIEHLLTEYSGNFRVPLGALESNDEARAQMVDEVRQVERTKLLACSQEEVEQFILESINRLKEMVDAWRRGDSETILGLSHNELAGFEELSEQVLSKRNVSMTDNIDHVLRTSEGPHFFAVGAAHLPGDDGIVELLKRKGWTLRKT